MRSGTGRTSPGSNERGACPVTRRLARVLPLVALLAALCASLAAPARAQRPAACGPQDGKLALVLAGGGAKAFAHVGVMRMLDSLGIVPDLVVGTSAGAMVGALYASGLKVDDITRQALGLGLDSLIGQYGADIPPSLGDRRAILAWEGGAQGFSLQTSVVREAPLNALMTSLYVRGNLMARGNFDRLPIPFRAVAADIHTREAVVLGSGDLAQAVRASSSIPIVFRTVHIGGRDLVDGGIANNVPVDVARSLGATRIIVSALLDTVVPDRHADDPLSVAAQLVNLLFEKTLPPLRPGELLVQSDVNAVTQLDFSAGNIARVIAAGDRAAVALKDDRCLTRGKTRRAGVVPPIASALTQQGTDPDVARVLRVTIGPLDGQAIEVPELQQRLHKLSQVERYREIWLHPVQGPGDSVLFAAEGSASSAERQLAGAAFDRDLGARLWAGRVKRFPQRNLEATTVVEIGQLEQEASLTLRRAYDVLRSPWSPLLGTTLARTRVRDIRDGVEYPEIQTADWLVEFGVERRFSRRVFVGLTAFARQWDEPVFAGSPTAPGGRLRFQMLGSANSARSTVQLEGTPRYWRATAELQVPWVVRRLRVEPTLSAVVGEGMPLQNSAYLGGDNAGFPGFKIQELRGAQAAMATLQLSHPLFGPLSLRALVAGGALQRDNYGVFRNARGYFGASAGFGIGTALGPVVIEFGGNDHGRYNLWFRFGDWF